MLDFKRLRLPEWPFDMVVNRSRQLVVSDLISLCDISGRFRAFLMLSCGNRFVGFRRSDNTFVVWRRSMLANSSKVVLEVSVDDVGDSASRVHGVIRHNGFCWIGQWYFWIVLVGIACAPVLLLAVMVILRKDFDANTVNTALSSLPVTFVMAILFGAVMAMGMRFTYRLARHEIPDLRELLAEISRERAFLDSEGRQ